MVVFLIFLAFSLVLGEDVNVTTSEGVVTSSEAPKGQILAQDLTGEVIPPAMKAISKASAAEPSLGLHGITEQQLNMRYYNFICSSHFHLDCKITETLQICMKGRYVAVLGLPLSFEEGSQDQTFISKWIRTCDQNDQDMNQEAMRVIRKRIHYQNENNWENVFKSSSSLSILPGLLLVVTAFAKIF